MSLLSLELGIRIMALEFVGRVLVNAQVHAEVGLVDVVTVGLVPCAQQALVDERLHNVERRWRACDWREIKRRFGGLDRESSFEYGTLCQGGLLPRGQQVP